jgi:hypothetical protein
VILIRDHAVLSSGKETNELRKKERKKGRKRRIALKFVGGREVISVEGVGYSVSNSMASM